MYRTDISMAPMGFDKALKCIKNQKDMK